MVKDIEKLNKARQTLSSSQGLMDSFTLMKRGTQTANPLGQGTLNMGGQASRETSLPMRMAQETVKAPLRVGGAMVDVGRQAMGQQPLPRTNIPGLGEFATPARNTYDESMQTNDPMQLASIGIKNASTGILDTATTGGLANLAAGAGNLAQTVGRHLTSAKQVLTEMPGVDKMGLAKSTLTNIKDAAVREAGQGMYGAAGDVMAATAPAVDTLADEIASVADEIDDESTAELGAALGINNLSQKQLIESRDALHEKIKNTYKPNARKKYIKAFKLILKLIK